MSTLNLHVSDEADMAQRFVSAWKRAEQGESVDERHLTFLTLETLLCALTPQRLELLRYVHRHGTDSVAALARELGRDSKRVHEDVAMLEANGLILREDGHLTAPWERLAADLML
ncbi:hypothetical protein [uncultured Thiodictyon sp.]|uniref:HVO_A0114 family putative DNA-binding protein n=1 Tax=uncultured Thiodictyon sp. TaxID=1846217 RepID=UPI0025E77031|nr:hypothetical protein [uncultured Thiodictyon sp.]